MKKLFKLLVLLMFVAVVAAAVAAFVSRKKFEAMSDDEIRGFLANKLEGKVASDQLTSIQDAVIAGVRAKSGMADEDVVTEVADVAEELVEIADESADGATTTSKAKANKAAKKASEAIEAIVAVSDEGD
jgi:hypothetical protein